MIIHFCTIDRLKLMPSLGPPFLVSVLIVLTLAGCSVLRLITPEREFVRVQNGRLMEGADLYLFVGANFWYGPYLAMDDTGRGKERLSRELDMLAQDGVTNLRLPAFSERSRIPWALTPSVVNGPGDLNEDLLRGLDVVLDEMAQRDMRAVLFLTNYWEWSGGMTSYLDWADSTTFVDPEREGWEAYMDYAGSFGANERAQTIFRDHLRRLITRVNSVNGRRYADDPTIMAWQLANEPRSGTVSPAGEAMMPRFIAWVDTTARYIKSLDSRHLVSTGSEGVIGSLVSEEHFLGIHRSPAVDYLTFHLWPVVWRWYDPKHPDSTSASAESLSVAYIHQHIRLARLLGKPIVLEEFGMSRDTGGYDPATPVTVRDDWFRMFFSIIEDSAAADAPLVGSNVWAWGGEGRGRPPEYRYRNGDPFTGDPSHEPQGFNSVFDTDTTTRRILREHAASLRSLTSRPVRVVAAEMKE